MTAPRSGPYTVTGRRLSRAPEWKLTSNRAAQASQRRFDQWIIDEAIAEAKSKSDDYNLIWLQAEKPVMPDGIRTCMWQYLFGHEDMVIVWDD